MGTNCKFGWSVAIYNFNVSLFCRNHLLPSHHNKTQRKFKLVDHLEPELSTKRTAGYVVFHHIIKQLNHILAHARRNNVYTGSCGQRREQVIYRGIETETRMGTMIVFACNLQVVKMPGCQRPQRFVAYHYPFRFSGRSRGIDHIGEVFRCRSRKQCGNLLKEIELVNEKNCFYLEIAFVPFGLKQRTL